MSSNDNLPPTRPPPDTETIGRLPASDVVRSEILQYPFSRGELSRRTGVHAAIISRFMNKHATITLTTFELLAVELGLWVASTKAL